MSQICGLFADFFLQDSVVTNPAISLVCLHLLDVYNFAEYAYK